MPQRMGFRVPLKTRKTLADDAPVIGLPNRIRSRQLMLSPAAIHADGRKHDLDQRGDGITPGSFHGGDEIPPGTFHGR